jgi:hypothetical protein
LNWVSKKKGVLLKLYPSDLKNWEFDKEALQIFCSSRMAVLIDTAGGLNKKSEAKPT